MSYCPRQRYKPRTNWLDQIPVAYSCHTNWSIKLKFHYGKFLLLLVINTIMVVIIILIKLKLFESFGHTYFLNPTKLNTFFSSVMYLYSFMYNGVIEIDFYLREMVVAYHKNYSCHPVVITTSKPFDLQ